MSEAQIKRRIAQLRKHVAAKQLVLQRHAVGSPYHTRATREVQSYLDELNVLQSLVEVGE